MEIRIWINQDGVDYAIGTNGHKVLVPSNYRLSSGFCPISTAGFLGLFSGSSHSRIRLTVKPLSGTLSIITEEKEGVANHVLTQSLHQDVTPITSDNILLARESNIGLAWCHWVRCHPLPGKEANILWTTIEATTLFLSDWNYLDTSHFFMKIHSSTLPGRRHKKPI